MTATSIVIFGASGDLTHRKLIPALYHQFKSKRLPDDLNIIGVSRTKYEHHEFRDSMKEAVKEFNGNFDEDTWEQFAPHLYYLPSDA